MCCSPETASYYTDSPLVLATARQYVGTPTMPMVRLSPAHILGTFIRACPSTLRVTLPLARVPLKPVTARAKAGTSPMLPVCLPFALARTSPCQCEGPLPMAVPLAPVPHILVPVCI
jgi:hypothetical protein